MTHGQPVAPTTNRGVAGRGHARARGFSCLLVAVAFAVPSSAPAAAQSDLAVLARGADAATMRFAFPARPGVCGAGDAIVIREADGSTSFMGGHMSSSEWRRWRAGEPPCEVGDVVVEMTRHAPSYGDVQLRVGEPGPSVPADLGLFTGQDAADFLLAEAARADERAARQMILASSLADEATTWPALLRLAKDRSLARGTRRTALHWLGRQAAAEAAAALGGIVRDRTEADEIREAAVFGLSQLPREEAVNRLIEVYRTIEEPRIRSRALFWLADLEDPRVIALFEEILSGS